MTSKRTLDLTPAAGEMLKPRELVDLSGAGPLTLQDRRVFNELVQNAWGPDLGKGGRWFEIETGRLRSATDRNERLATSLERLMRTICTVVSEDGKSEMRTPLLSSNELRTGTNEGVLRYKLTEELASMLKDSTIFAKLDLEVMRSFGSKYAFSLYEAIARRVRMRRFMEELSVIEMREVLGVETGKLTAYKNLNFRAIQPALTEVNALTDFEVSIIPKKRGKAVVGFAMGWNMKNEDGRVEAKKERDRPRVGREARRAGDTESVILNERLAGP
ncbi:replication initiation protein [Sulfitobacter sp. M23508]|uniref:replication initiation protein n=1 Tax=Sulfitobacter sp. M23508 TaxID=3368577 RepID=UPI003746B860